MSDFVHLHVHSHYSLMDGLNTPRELLEAAKEHGQTALAVTDHGTLSSHRPMQKAAADLGMKPILGLEAYISPTDRFDKRDVKKRDDNTQLYNHIILLAQNEKGLKNLQTLSYKAWHEGYYYKPRIDREILAEYKDGLVVLSGCMNGLISKAIEREQMGDARILTRWFAQTFGDKFYMEIQPHNPTELNRALLDLADEVGVPPVVTADCHFDRAENRAVEEAMLILSTSPKKDREAKFEQTSKIKNVFDRYNAVYPERKISFEHLDVYVSHRDDLAKALAEQGIVRTDVFDNTVEIAEGAETLPILTNLDLFPSPRGVDDADERLERDAREGLLRLGLSGVAEYEERLAEELGIIKDKGFSAYMLVIADIVRYAKSQNILVGPGRGSAVGCLTAYALGITSVDPLQYGLLFFRFINPERNDFPDIDLDFEDARRGEVKDYVRRTYGHAASIMTFGKFQGKRAIRDAARVYDIPLGEVAKALKGIDAPVEMDYFSIFYGKPKGKEFSNKYPEVIDLAKKLHGRIRETGMHAAGVVVSKKPLADLVPIETAKDPNDKNGPRLSVVALDMEEAEDFGLIKIDLLGLNNLTVIHSTLDEIRRRKGKTINLLTIDRNDSNVYNELAKGYTQGIFQAEAGPYTEMVIKMKVSNFDELAVSNALVRPGAANTIGKSYLARKQGKEPVKYLHPILEPITKDTFGCIVYQEQVMQACVALGGMTMSEADKVRKIIGKKKDVREFDAFKDKFINGASKHIPEAAAEALWHDFEAHAGYSFNKSHAVAYSLISYWTAWLKHYYPLEFMFSLLKHQPDSTDAKEKRTSYLIEAKRLGVRVLLPHVEASSEKFAIHNEGLRFGLSDIKFLSTKLSSRLIARRPFGSYAKLVEVVTEKNSGLNTRVLSALNAVGAAAYDDNPRTGDERSNLYEYLGIPAFEVKDMPPTVKAQFVNLDEYDDKGAFPVMAMVKKIKRGDGWALVDLVDETGSAGAFTDAETTIEPGQMYAFLIANNRIAKYSTMDDVVENRPDPFVNYLYADGYPDVTSGFYKVVAFRTRRTKKGARMADIVLSDAEKNLYPALAFPREFNKAYGKCQEGAVAEIVLGKTDDGTLFLNEIY